MALAAHQADVATGKVLKTRSQSVKQFDLRAIAVGSY